MVTSVRIDGCAHEKNPDSIIKDTKYLHQKNTIPKISPGIVLITLRHNNSVVNYCKVKYFGIRSINSSTNYKLSINQSILTLGKRSEARGFNPSPQKTFPYFKNKWPSNQENKTLLMPKILICYKINYSMKYFDGDCFHCFKHDFRSKYCPSKQMISAQ